MTKESTLNQYISLKKETINPQRFPNDFFYVYSLPAFDNNKTPELSRGLEIESSKDIVNSNCILFNKLNVRFKRIWNVKEVQTNAVCSGEFLQLQARGCEQDYLYYFLSSNPITSFLIGASGGTSHSHSRIGFGDLHGIPAVFPDILVQKKIAIVLSSLDSKIELNNRTNAELEAMAKTLYDYWFVQFDFPNADNKPYKSSGGKMIYDETLRRDIPAGWSATTLATFCEITRGVTYQKTDVSTSDDENCTPILRATNITGSTLDLDDMVYVPSYLVSREQSLKKFDVIMTMSSGSKEHVGKNAFCYFDIKMSFGAFCSKISIKRDYLFYTYTFLHSVSFKKYISNVGLGTNINNLTNDHISGCVAVSPSHKILADFDNIVTPLFEKIAQNVRENQELARLRDWLLPMLMNGQVTIK